MNAHSIPTANLAVSAIYSALIALLFDLEKLVEFMSIGTLLAYTIVSASVMILRYRPESSVSVLSDTADCISISTASTQSDNMELCLAGRLKPKYYWLSNVLGHCNPGSVTPSAVLVFTVCSAALSVQLHLSLNELREARWWAIFTFGFLVLVLIGCVLVIGAHEQNPSTGTFRVPLVPLIPCLSILSNVALMVHLNPLTWFRFLIWMTLGLLVYFFYGIRHSKEGDLSHAVLMTCSEANKLPWGAVIGGDTTVVRVKATRSRNATDEDKAALIDDDD